MTTRTAVRREELRAALVDAAERAIAARGLGGLRARDLARDVGCALGAIYNAFPSLDALVFAVNARTLREIDAFISARQGPLSGRTAAERAVAELAALAVGYVEYAAANTPRWRALFDHRMTSAEETVPAWYAEEQVRLFSRIEGPLAMLRPELDGDALALSARTLFSGVHGIISLGLEAKLASLSLAVLRNQVEEFATILGRGLAAAKTRS